MNHSTTSLDLKLTRRDALASVAALACPAPLLAQTTAPAPAPVRATLAPAPPPQLGVYQGAGCTGRDRIPLYEQWLGRRVERVVDSLSQVSWDQMVSTARWSTGCWQPAPVRLTLTLPMIPRDGKSTIAIGMGGAYDGYFRTIGERLVETGFANATLRIGPEFNGSWFQWNALSSPNAWVAYWRRIVRTLRTVPGQQFTFDWCPTLGPGAKSPEPAYPGDEFVDFIGADVYNANWQPQTITTPEQLWNQYLTSPYGLRWHQRFAAEHGKPMTYPEWATGTRPDGFGGGDDPVFITNMANWIKNNPVLYHNYWDYPAQDYNGRLSDGSKPKAAAAYLAAFGGGR
jgi:hypothetical protein